MVDKHNADNMVLSLNLGLVVNSLRLSGGQRDRWALVVKN